ncbi:hypothetical protein [Hymenobacter aerophilus]|uniref:hypothetical protein n=1 Tax=Hymenobacter aerophilus TaxID=119644 RepID=UPI00036A0D1C|nr:hypothetical protein [Hymenobacter aerophilus]
MSVTRLKRKHRKNIARANNKQRIIKQLLLTPVLKNVDLDELKASFGGGRPDIAPKTEAIAAAIHESEAATEAAANSGLSQLESAD